MRFTIQQIADTIGAEIIGDAAHRLDTLSSVEEIAEGALVFAQGKDKLSKAESSAAAAILTDFSYERSEKILLRVERPDEAFHALITFFYAPRPVSPGIHPTAVIGDDVVIGAGVSVGAYVCIGNEAVIGDGTVLQSHVTIGAGVTIGRNTVIHPNVCIYDDSVIGEDVTVHAGVVIGSDGFGYKLVDGAHKKIPHAGRVEIENNVEIGANTTIDRATLGTTRIGEGTKIDNHVQIAHSVKLGKHNILCAFTGIAGSTVSGDYVIFAADVGVSDHVRIDDGVILGARTGVPPNKHLKANQVYLGAPSRPREKALEMELGMARLPGMRKRIAKLEDSVKALRSSLDNES